MFWKKENYVLGPLSLPLLFSTAKCKIWKSVAVTILYVARVSSHDQEYENKSKLSSIIFERERERGMDNVYEGTRTADDLL